MVWLCKGDSCQPQYFVSGVRLTPVVRYNVFLDRERLQLQ